MAAFGFRETTSSTHKQAKPNARCLMFALLRGQFSDAVGTRRGGVGSRTRWGQGMRNGSGIRSVQVGRPALDPRLHPLMSNARIDSAQRLLLEVGKELSPTKVGVFAFDWRCRHRKRSSVVGPHIDRRCKGGASPHD